MAVSAVTWSPDSTRVASAAEDSTVFVWNTDSKDLRGFPAIYLVLPSGSPTKIFTSIAWSPDGTQIAVGSNGPKLYPGCPTVYVGIMVGNTPSMKRWKPDPRAEEERAITVHIWDARSGEYIAAGGRVHHPPVSTITWDPRVGSDVIVSGHINGTITAWNSRTGKLVYTLQGHNKDITDIAWSLGGGLATVSADKTLRTWPDFTFVRPLSQYSSVPKKALLACLVANHRYRLLSESKAALTFASAPWLPIELWLYGSCAIFSYLRGIDMFPPGK